VFFLGGGTNLLVSDSGFAGLVIKTSFSFVHIDETEAFVRVGASVPSAVLVDRLIGEEWGGLEFAAGLPGTIGGAVAGNAGCFGHQIGELLINATVVDRTGLVTTIDDPGWFGFDYRDSQLLSTGAFLVDANFAVQKESRADLASRAGRYVSVRRQKHPAPGTRTAGSYFKNLPPEEPGGQRRAAGALLDQVGAKSLRVGDAAVFERHANIVVNRGEATAKDVLALTAEMRRRVYEQFGEELTPEVHFVGKT